MAWYGFVLSIGLQLVLALEKKEKVEPKFLLDHSCGECWPGSPEKCSPETWSSCCDEELDCHQKLCIGEVLGKLKLKQRVRVKEDFVSDDSKRVTITKGMIGKVLDVDFLGDAFISFAQDEYDEDYKKHWVWVETAWSKLELPGKMDRHRAAKIGRCLDNCTQHVHCMPTDGMSKKELKDYQGCMYGCKVEDCSKDPDCKKLLAKYATCKHRLAGSSLCQPDHHLHKGVDAEL
mmetsp:Transcript_31989/g.73021  ORF Transcript_31989/g.73021 Transcript_31989/m.73021 type:complete len:233 (-) Transcript_31989:14-712(-)